MNDFRPKELISEAKTLTAEASYSPRKLALIHAGVAAAAGLILTVLTYLLDIGIGSSGGLSGIGNRALLETVQSVLQLAASVLSPFWALGFVAAALHLSRRQEANANTLLAGLRRWGPALRMLLLEGLIYFAIIMVAVQIGSLLYTFSPAASQLETLVEQIVTAGDADALTALLENLDEETLVGILLGMLPFLLVPMALMLIPVAYRLRLAQYILMDEPGCGALMAITLSFAMTKGNCLKLLKLDLRYWWFYLLEVVVILLGFADVLLPLLLPGLEANATVLATVFYVVALGGQLALYAWKKPQVYTTYALFYHRLIPQQQPQTEM